MRLAISEGLKPDSFEVLVMMPSRGKEPRIVLAHVKRKLNHCLPQSGLSVALYFLIHVRLDVAKVVHKLRAAQRVELPHHHVHAAMVGSHAADKLPRDAQPPVFVCQQAQHARHGQQREHAEEECDMPEDATHQAAAGQLGQEMTHIVRRDVVIDVVGVFKWVFHNFF